jgi:hypothetical protein
MSWLSSWWDKASGANQKVDPNKLGTQYDESMSGVNQGYDKLSDFASGMMDPYSQQNMAMRSSMNQQGADAAAQGARMGDRSAAMAGGAPAAALAAQSSAGANQAMAGSNQAFNQYLSGAQQQGAGMLSGVLANQGQMQDRRFNMVQSQRQANAMADTQGAQFGANLLGTAIGMIPGVGGQTGGHVGYQEGGEPLYEGLAYDNIDNQIAFYKEGGAVGPQYGPDGKPRFLLGGLLGGVMALGVLKKGYDKLKGPVKGISETLGKAPESIKSGLGEMKADAQAVDFHYTDDQARNELFKEHLLTDKGREAGKSAATISEEQLNEANVGLKYGDEGFQTQEMMETASTQAFEDKTKSGFDVSQGAHQVGAGRALAETIQPLTSFAGSSIAEGAGLLGKAAVGTAGAVKGAAGAVYEGAKGVAGKAWRGSKKDDKGNLKKDAKGLTEGQEGFDEKTAYTGGIRGDWQKEEGSRGKGLLRSASQLLKEVGSPGYLQGKEMAKIKRLGRLKDGDDIGTGELGDNDGKDDGSSSGGFNEQQMQELKDYFNQKNVDADGNPIQGPYRPSQDPSSEFYEGKISAQIDPNNPDPGRVNTERGALVPNTLLSKVGRVEDLSNMPRAEVKTIQAALAEAGYDMSKSLKADETYDGEVGEETKAMMQKWIDESAEGEQHGDVELRSLSTPDISYDPQMQQGGYIGGLLGMQQGGDPAEKEWRSPHMIKNDEFFGEQQWETLEDYQKWYDKARESNPEEFGAPDEPPPNVGGGLRPLEHLPNAGGGQPFPPIPEPRPAYNPGWQRPLMQEGGDPREYRTQLEGSDAEWQSKLESNLYTPEGDYTKEGLLGKYGFTSEAVVDTSYGGYGPNQAVGMNISEGNRSLDLNMGAGNRWEDDKELSESRIKGEWSEADRAAGRGYTFGEGYHPDSYAGYQTQKIREENAKEMEDFFGPGGFQEGGTVWNQVSGQSPSQVRGGILSQVMGPKGPMNIPTRMGGFRVTG